MEIERALAGMLRRAIKIKDEVDGGGVTTKTRYLLGKRDRAAIGTVTAEVLALVSLKALTSMWILTRPRTLMGPRSVVSARRVALSTTALSARKELR